jgi:predicted MFS family arabinose efflux permease
VGRGRIEPVPVLPASYGSLLRTPAVGRALATSVLARIGQPAGGLAVVLLAVDRTGSYGVGGLVSAVWTVAGGIGLFVWSRLVDRGRSARTVLITTSLLSSAGLITLAAVPTSGVLVLAALTAAAAVFEAPVPPVTRALWPVLLSEPDARAAMYSLEATVQELTYIVGPSLAGAAAAAVSPAAAVVLAGAIELVGVLLFATTPGLHRVGSDTPARIRWAAIRPLLPLFAAGFLLVSGFAWVEVGIVGAAGSAGQIALAGPLIAVWSVGSMLGGLVAGARPPRRGPARRLVVLLAAVAVGHALLAAYPGLLVLGVLLALVGAVVAPALGGVYTLVERLAPAGAVTQTFAVLSVAFLSGAAAGSAPAGLVVQAYGPSLAFLLAAVPPGLAAVVVGVTIARRAVVPSAAG